MKAVIIDDEKHCSESLVYLIKKYCRHQINECLSFNDPIEGLQYLEKNNTDILFLDIEMPTLSGFNLLKELKEPKPEIVFTTAYDEFGIKAIKVSAIDYLLKPIDRDELTLAIEKAGVRIKEKSQNQDIVLEKIFPYQNFGKISIPTSEGFEFLETNDIIYCKSDSNYTEFILKDNKLLVSRTLKDIETQLKTFHFIRIHHSYLINANHIKKYSRGTGGSVVMSNKDVLPVSRSRKNDLLNTFM